MNAMNPEVKAMWLTALRSGEYEQADEVLCRVGKDGAKDSYCCLGVLMDLAVKAGVAEDISGSASIITYRRYRDIGDDLSETAVITRGVMDWAGLGDQNPSVTPVEYFEHYDYETLTKSAKSLAELNDGAKYTFAQIADVIEAQF